MFKWHHIAIMATRENYYSTGIGRNTGLVDVVHDSDDDLTDAPPTTTSLEAVGGDSFGASVLFRGGYEEGHGGGDVLEDVSGRVKNISLNPQVATYSGSGTISYTPLAAYDGPQFHQLNFDDKAAGQTAGARYFEDDAMESVGSSLDVDRVANLVGNDKIHDSDEREVLQQSQTLDLADSQPILNGNAVSPKDASRAAR